MVRPGGTNTCQTDPLSRMLLRAAFRLRVLFEARLQVRVGQLRNGIACG
jgi:hypothetical protein